MGSSSSKDASATGASRRARRDRSMGVRVFRPACLRRPQVSLDDGNEEETGRTKEIECSEKIRKSREDINGCRCSDSLQSQSLPLSNNVNRLDGDTEDSSSTTSMESNTSSANQASASCPMHFHSCFGLSRKGSKLSGSVNPSSNNHAHLCCQCNSSLPSEFHNCLGRALNSSADIAGEHYSKNANDIVASTDTAASNANTNEGECPPRNTATVGSIERNLSQRRQEPLEGTARFSRTRSVGRLRNRVLRRTSFPEGRFGFLFTEESSAFSRQDSRRRLLDALANIPYTDGESNDRQLSSSNHQLAGNSNAENTHDNGPGTSELRETSSHDAIEHNSTFFERRRRIRSQVRALQRLGSRFENISGHDRQCILSGQHRIGNCTCRMSNRSRNPPEQTSTRASISRIVMLAEALFEVLDEIHQQAVVLASRPSTASTGSVPAPKEIVDRMPVKTYVKSQKRRSDESAQCYICLVEYEEGDSLRILPCLHDFHQSCVDKWLKEIHRVCPLCRYDVCLSHVDGLE